MPVFAVTGVLCGGKTTVLNILKKKGAHVYNVDKVIHSYYKNKNSEVYRRVKELFPCALAKNGNISRLKLRKLVLNERKSLKKLERIVHPEAVNDLKKWIGKAKKEKGVYIAEVPLLFEKRLEKIFDKVVFVYTPRSIILKRLKDKFGIPPKEALKFISLRSDFKGKMEKSDFVINNNRSKKRFITEINHLWQELR
ncbi:MAG: dephospho-CoA kinase [Candidatus Omnitrophica bacterium]|nr:dephospho-CoA kinase [Candidatus Omnitrophota bacterium]